MKKLLPVVSVLGLSLLSATTIFAQTTKPLVRPINSAALERLREQAQNLRMKVDERKASASSKLEDRREKIASKEARFKAFKDQKKAEIATRLDDNFNNVNTKVTDAMLTHLAKISDILARVSDRAEVATNGASLQTVIDSAQTAITNAQSAINAQKAKTYTITTSTEASLATNARSTREKLMTDLKAVRQTVALAKDAVVKVYQAAKALKEANGTAN